MRLFELTGVKSLQYSSVTELINLLQKGRFAEIGKGNFAKVFIGPDNSIYKFWLVDSAYEKFVDFALAHQSNPFLPKFKSKVKTLTRFFHSDPSFPKKIKYIKMEWLQELSNNYMLPGTLVPVVQIIKTLYKSCVVKDVDLETVDWVEKFGSNLRSEASERERKNFYKFLYDLAYTLLDLDTLDVKDRVTAGDGPDKLDLNEHNIMLRRGTDQIVIVDPVASEADAEIVDMLRDRIQDLR